MNKEKKGRRKAKQCLSHSESFMEWGFLCGLKISYETVLLEGHGNDFLPEKKKMEKHFCQTPSPIMAGKITAKQEIGLKIAGLSFSTNGSN